MDDDRRWPIDPASIAATHHTPVACSQVLVLAVTSLPHVRGHAPPGSGLPPKPLNLPARKKRHAIDRTMECSTERSVEDSMECSMACRRLDGPLDFEDSLAPWPSKTRWPPGLRRLDGPLAFEDSMAPWPSKTRWPLGLRRLGCSLFSIPIAVAPTKTFGHNFFFSQSQVCVTQF